MPDFQRIDCAATYTPAEAAALTGKVPRTVRAAIRSGALPATRESGGYRIAGADLAAWQRMPARARSAPPTGLAAPPPDPAGPIDPEATYAMLPAMRAKGVGQHTIEDALRSGRLPAIRPGFRWQIRGSDLLAWEPRARTVPARALSMAQAANLAGVAHSAAYRAVREGRLPATWSGRRWLVDSDEAAAWAASYAPVEGPIDPDRLYVPAVAARLVGVSRQAVSQAIRAGKLEAIESDDGPWVQGADVLAWHGRSRIGRPPRDG